jgi:transposase InsO family protein
VLLSAQVLTSHRQSRHNYGAPRILADLHEQGVRISQRRCARLMRQLGIRGRKRRRRRPRTTDSGHGRAVPGNERAHQRPPSGQNQVWVTDITYVRTAEGWLYLAAILDLWSRRVVGWACSTTMQASLVLAALHQALAQRHPPKGLVHHSDRGSQYVDEAYVQTLAAHGIVRSMSRTACCYDNAEMESFWSTVKTETELDVILPRSHAEAELAIFDYIETFYNPTRRHSSLGYRSPAAFEKQTN